MKKNSTYNFLSMKAMAISLMVLLISVSSCKKGLDINVDPNNPTDVPLRTVLPSAQANLAYTLGGSINRIGGSIIQHYSGHRNQPLEYNRFDLTPATTDNIWSSMYAGVLEDLSNITTKGTEGGDLVYVGVAKILSAYTYSILTDSYGDIPFSNALGGVEIINPAYDTQESIYPQLITMLDEGIAAVKSGSGSEKPGSDDLIFGGDVVKWERFANTLKLRLLNHTSKVNAGAALAFLNTNPILMTSNADNGAFGFGTTASTSNPIYQFDVISGRNDNAISSTLINKMKGLNDPRISAFFYPVKNGALAGQYLGNVPGGDNDDSGETKFSRVGTAYAATDAPVVFLSYAEQNFIIAEVQQRAGNNAAAGTAYNNAINADLTYLGVSASAASTYLGQSTVAFNNTLQRIMEQKWITMFQGPYESWVDWRRTGFPVLTPPAVNRTGGVFPRRFPYPQLEINLNGEALANGPGIPIPYKTFLTGVWWDK